MSRGYVADSPGNYVLNGFIFGFDLGVQRFALHGARVFSNYPSAVGARGSVSDAIESRVARSKSVLLGPAVEALAELRSAFSDLFCFPMGAVAKPHDPTVMRPTSDHTRTGLNAGTVLGILGHSLDTYNKLSHLLSSGAWMTVADVDDAFSYIPLIPWLWPFMLFRWFQCRSKLSSDKSAGERLYLYCNLFADFGTRGAPGTFKLILVDVFVGMARSEFVLTLPLLVYVDDTALISPDEASGNAEMAAFMAWTSEIGGLRWKLAKLLAASQLQLYIGFWWSSRTFSRSLPEKKLLQYLDVLLVAARSPSLTLRDRQSLAGKMQRGIMTLPPGAACLLVNCYILMNGLAFSWQRRRTTRAERLDYQFVHALLKFNQGQGYYSYDGFIPGPGFRSDASKSSRLAGGGYVCEDGSYDLFTYGSSAQRKPIDYLEGDTALRCCVHRGPNWGNMLIPAGIDNKCVERSADNGRSRAPRINDLMRGFFVVQIKHSFILQPYWISSKDNYLADDLSRDREQSFLDKAYDFVSSGFPLIRHPDAGRVVTLADNDYNDAMSGLRQLLKSYSSNDIGDGPSRGKGVAGDAQLLSIPFHHGSIFEGLPLELFDRLDEVMDTRLRPASMRKVVSSFNKWESFCVSRDWAPLLQSREPARGGRMAAWILSMVDDTDLVFSSISTYVWGMRTWHTLQHQSDPAMGVEFFSEFMRSVSVLTAVPGEPRKRVPLAILAAILEDIYTNHWNIRVMVQLGLVLLILMLTFSRTECPCPKNFTGPDSWDPKKHWQVRDFVLRKFNGYWVLWVRFKAIKQDPRVERPQARHANSNLPSDFEEGGREDSKDWVPLGDVPGIPHFSVALFYMRFVSLVGRERLPTEPFFLASDGVRPYTYRALCSEFKQAVILQGGDADAAPHGIRVEMYVNSKRANGLDITVAHGGWSAESSGHERYDRFAHLDVLGIPAAMFGVRSVFAPDPSGRVVGAPTVRGAPAKLAGRAVLSPAALDAKDSDSDDSSEGGADFTLSLVPQGYTSEQLLSEAGRRYTSYLAPDGTRLSSRPQCWKHHSSLVDAGVGRSRRGVCGTISPDHSRVCSFVNGHDGLHEFESVSSRRSA